MPRIREYTQDVGAASDIPGHRASAEDFGAGAHAGVAEAIGGLGATLGKTADVVQAVAERQEVTDVHAKLAQARADWTLELQKRATESPAGDPNFAGKFTDDFSQALQKMEGDVQTRVGQEAFRKGAAELSAHFVEKAGLFQAQSAGVKARQDYNTLLDANRNTLISDPTQFESVLKTTQAALADPNGSYAKMNGDDREKLTNATRKELAMSAVQGTIRLAPELALKQLEDGRWDQYLDADKKYTLERTAEIGIRAKEVEAERVARAEEKARKDAIRATQEDIVQKLGAGKLTTKDVMESDLPAVGDGSKEHFLNVLRTRSKEAAETPIRTVPSVMMGLFDRIHAADDDPRKITNENEINNAYLAKTLSWDDMTRLRKEVADARTPDGERLGKKRNDFITGIAAQIDKSNPLMGKLDPSGKQALYEFSHFVDLKMQEYRQDGKKNVYDLFDPSKPDYLGRPEALAGFQKPMSQSIKDFSDRLNRQPGATAPTGGVPADKARKPGETPAQYLKRMGG